jgi:hypothetical protein
MRLPRFAWRPFLHSGWLAVERLTRSGGLDFGSHRFFRLPMIDLQANPKKEEVQD